MRSSIEAVLFDLDGTLVDSAPDLAHAANVLRMRDGLDPLPLHAYRPHVGTGARGMLNIAFGMGPEHADFAQYKEAFFQAYEDCLRRASAPFEGVDALVAALESAGCPWGIVTNKMERFTHPLVQSIACFEGAGAVIAGDTTPYSKPHPEPLLEAARRLKVPPQACVYVGDDERDIQAARAAGMQAVVAAYGYLGTGRWQEWGADAVIEKPLDLTRWLDLP